MFGTIEGGGRGGNIRGFPVQTTATRVSESGGEEVGRPAAVMSTALLAFVAVVLCVLFRLLNVNSQPQKPTVLCGDGKFLDTILKIATLISEP